MFLEAPNPGQVPLAARRSGAKTRAEVPPLADSALTSGTERIYVQDRTHFKRPARYQESRT